MAAQLELRIRREAGGFSADLRDGCGNLWKSGAMPLRELVAELAARGCPQRQIGDALAPVDPSFQEQLGAR